MGAEKIEQDVRTAEHQESCADGAVFVDGQFIWIADLEKQQQGLHAFQIRGDLPGRPVHGDPPSCLDEFCGVRDADDGRYAVLAGNDGPVGHRPAHLHNESACGEEEGCPTGVCRGRYQDLTRLQAGLTRVQDHTRFLCHHPA